MSTKVVRSSCGNSPSQPPERAKCTVARAMTHPRAVTHLPPRPSCPEGRWSAPVQSKCVRCSFHMICIDMSPITPLCCSGLRWHTRRQDRTQIICPVRVHLLGLHARRSVDDGRCHVGGALPTEQQSNPRQWTASAQLPQRCLSLRVSKRGWGEAEFRTGGVRTRAAMRWR